MVIEVVLLRVVLVSDVDHGDGRVFQIVLGRVATRNGDGGYGQEHRAGEEFIFMCPTWVRND